MRERQWVHKNDYSKRACDSVAPDSLCLAWLNDGVSAGVVSSYSEWLNWYAAVCMWSHCLLHMLPRLQEGLVAF